MLEKKIFISIGVGAFKLFITDSHLATQYLICYARSHL